MPVEFLRSRQDPLRRPFFPAASRLPHCRPSRDAVDRDVAIDALVERRMRFVEQKRILPKA
jgi:hypothetical protein